MNVVRRHGLKVSRMPVSDNADEVLTCLRALLTARTRLVAVSHVTTDSGTRLPVAEIARLAHERDAYAFFDGAHSVGQFPVDVRAIGCDFYAMTGYKWLMGPYPSAALFVRGDRLGEIAVTWTGSNVTRTSSVTMGIDDLDWIPGAKRFEYGGRPYAYDTAMVTGLAYVDRLGIEAIEQHARDLTARLHDGLARVPGARIRSPRDPSEATGIAAVSLDGVDGVVLSAMLRDRWNMIQRPALGGSSVRISLAAFVEEDDVARLVECFATIAIA